ncbi:MAG TPA: PEPxxWA-CTERM sorting domain-containing protein [Sphingomonas sp.]|uniref:PEPxxWA-CTERM sorting domain-containing protein n=1 Tax=Sphingomonas sp. TaxID=28214 RepID=UPI002C989B3E|nr:PEPxxWA-CTERM sorting domain-containing protein [Sphingomonas sp.]HMI21256.1 PEPxxWA-CTERM sorting domain-containing protein [Sphingomonas sp.]
MSKLLGAVALAMAASAANAQTVYNTSLAPLNTATATTTTGATGTQTSSSAPSNARDTASAGNGVWFQSDVGGGATVGITTDYAHDGNGSALFETTGTSAKADLEFLFAQPLALSDLTSISYDYYRDASSTTMATLAPVMRLDISKDGLWAGSLVFENYYQQGGNAVVGDWTTVTATLDSGVIWATNSALGPKNAAADGGEKTFAEWLAGNSGHDLTVTGMSVGVGSGWTGSFKGAVDDVNVNFANGPHASYNFEVASVPEPASWAMMLGGFGLVGGMMRRRRSAIRFA